MGEGKSIKKKSVFQIHLMHLSVMLLVFVVFCGGLQFVTKKLLRPLYYDEIYKSVESSFRNKESYLVMLLLSDTVGEAGRIVDEAVFYDAADAKNLVPFDVDDYLRNNLKKVCTGKFEELSWANVCRTGGGFMFEIPVKSADNTLAHLKLTVSSTISSWAPYRLIRNGLFIMMLAACAIYIALVVKFYLQFARPISNAMSFFSRRKGFEDIGVLATVMPISELYELACEIEKNAKLVAIGKSAAMVAHDIRKPFANMKSLLKILPEKDNDRAFVNYAVSQVDDSIRKSESMIGEILDYSRDTKIDTGDVGVASMLVSALGDVFKNEGGVNISVNYNLAHKKCLKADEIKMSRVFANIIDNAAHAIGGKMGLDRNSSGNIWIDTSDVEMDGRKYVRVTLSNDGPGIDGEDLTHIFEPFFTKGKRGGTGLGLAICKKIVVAHGGKIWATSDSERTDFVILLPAAAKEDKIKNSDLISDSQSIRALMPQEPVFTSFTEDLGLFAKLHKQRAGESYLLIVDDEPLFRVTIRTLAERIQELRDNLKIVEADTAEVALKQFEAREFDYVISDIDMGRFVMDGYEFADIVLNKYPKTLVMIHSNKRAADRDALLIGRNNFRGFLPKPMGEGELVRFLAGKMFDDRQVRGEKRTADGDLRKEIKRVLVINDEAVMRMAMKIQLMRDGNVTVFDAANFDDAMDIIRSQRIDIIFADINLGDGGDGYEILKRVRTERRPIKFYMMSGMPMDDAWPKARDLGADGYIQLPYKDEDLKQIMK